MLSDQDSHRQADDLEQIEEEAITWVVRLTSGDCSAQTLAEFKAWRDLSPIHASELEKARALWVGVGGALPAEAKVDAAASTGSARAARASPAFTPSRRALGWALAACMVCALLLWVVAPTFSYDLHTATGEQQLVRLEDGSSIELNTASAMDVDFTRSRRQVKLAQGEAFFDVAHDPARPFVIDAGLGQVRVLGTAFAVRRDADSLWVTVVRGKVQVSTAAMDAPVSLTANQQLRLDANALHPSVAEVDADALLAWRSGLLHFEHQQLDRILHELNRYDTRYWLYSDSDLRRYKLNTLVELNNIDEWSNALSQSLPISVTRLGPVIWVRTR